MFLNPRRTRAALPQPKAAGDRLVLAVDVRTGYGRTPSAARTGCFATPSAGAGTST